MVGGLLLKSGQINNKGSHGKSMHRNWILLSLLAFVFGLLLTGCASQPSKPTNVHKLVMPGSYTVNCDSGTHTCWYFWRWKSKQLETKPHKIQVAIKDEYEKVVPSRPGINGIMREDRSGRQLLFFEVKQPGRFQITCKDKCILVIVPNAAQYESLGATLEFPGSDNDENFDPPG
jgi:hypothetical protein